MLFYWPTSFILTCFASLSNNISIQTTNHTALQVTLIQLPEVQPELSFPVICNHSSSALLPHLLSCPQRQSRAMGTPPDPGVKGERRKDQI